MRDYAVSGLRMGVGESDPSDIRNRTGRRFMRLPVRLDVWQREKLAICAGRPQLLLRDRRVEGTAGRVAV